MKALTYTSFLGIACLVLEILNLRKVVVPIVVIALAVILGLNFTEWNSTNIVFYHDMLRDDNFALAFTGLLIVTAMALVGMSGNFYQSEDSKIADYISIIIFTLCGAIALVSFANMAMLFIGLEVLSISLYILAGSKRRDIRSNEAAMKYFLMGSFASGILLFGITLVYGATGSFNLSEIARYASMGNVDPIFTVGTILILISMLFKVSAVPFHFWAPDVYEGSPTLTTAMMSTLSKVAAMAAFYRLFSICFVTNFSGFAWILSVIAALTMLVGNLTALNQDSFKRMLAYSGIANAGYMLLAIISLYNNSANALFYYAIAYSSALLGAFAVGIIVMKNMKSEKIEAFNGLGRKSPFLALALTLFMLSLAGIPPLAGFFGKYYVFFEAIKAKHIAVVIVAVITSAISVYYYFKLILAMWTKDSEESSFSADLPYTVIATICLLITLVLGVFPSIVPSITQVLAAK
jgi:NADH-quinone oxidoreductase subunit N